MAKYYQIKRSSDGKCLGGKAKYPVWTDTSLLFFKKRGISSFIGNARKYHPHTLLSEDNERTSYDDLEVAEVHISHANSVPLQSFLSDNQAT